MTLPEWVEGTCWDKEYGFYWCEDENVLPHLHAFLHEFEKKGGKQP